MLRNPEVEKTIACVTSSLAAMLEADVMILDDNKRVISGTAPPEKGYHVSQIYSHMLRSKEVVVVENPGGNPLCVGCEHCETCNELILLNAPIYVDDSFIGLISVTCYEEVKRQRILDKIEACSTFLVHMSSLIASRALEVQAKEALCISNAELSTIINSVDESIIALDSRDNVTFCNQLAARMLSISEAEIVGRPIKEFCPEYPAEKAFLLEGKQEMAIQNTRRQKTLYYVGARAIITEGVSTGTILTVEERNKVNRFVGSFIGSNRALSSTDIISVGPALEKVKRRTEKVSRTDSTVLIRGESGTGKEMFARAIHNMSRRSAGPLITLNCAAIPDTLLESELFGYESGAFTGAKKGGKPGHFELADTGTIFLDEIGDMPIYLQVKLLRVLQEKKIQRIGSSVEKRIDIRIIAATNKDLEKMVAESSFREDLFYRLNVIPIVIPPLRERGDRDVLQLISFFLNKYADRFDKPITTLADEARDALLAYRWPGNVRELENAVEYMLNMETGPVITIDSLPETIRKHYLQKGGQSQESLREQLAAREREILSEALSRCGTTQKGKEAAARALQIGIASLYRKIREYGLN